MHNPGRVWPLLVIAGLCLGVEAVARPQAGGAEGVDARVKRFLDEHRLGWHDLNVPEADGRALHAIVLNNRYTRALESGTYDHVTRLPYLESGFSAGVRASRKVRAR